MKEVWVVEVRYDNENPGVYGPYTEKQARRIEGILDDETSLATDAYGMNHHPHSILGAGAMPLERYAQFMTAQERRTVRLDVRAAEETARENTS